MCCQVYNDVDTYLTLADRSGHLVRRELVVNIASIDHCASEEVFSVGPQ
jgi:hypothetical protein